MGGSYVGSGGVPARRGVPVSVPPRTRSRFLCLELDDGGAREGPGVESIFFCPSVCCFYSVFGGGG